MSSSDPRALGVVCLILAAGAGERFGRRKQLAELAGRPLLQYPLDAANRSRAERVVLVLGAEAEAILARVELGRAQVRVCDDWHEGMAAPLRAGIEAVGDSEAAVILLGDQPFVGVAAVERILAARGPEYIAVRATYGGVPGHPVVIEGALLSEIAALRGDAGARLILDRPNVCRVPCDDIADPLDVDTLADLELARTRVAD